LTYLFWISAAAIILAYAGYPFWLWLRCRRKKMPVKRSHNVPLVSVVIAAHNEADVLPAKLRNILELNYPHNKIEVIVVSDGSTDGTGETLSELSDNRIRLFLCERKGKSAALNVGVENSNAGIVVFTDARQYIEPDALGYLMQSFADPCVGCVSGELMLVDTCSRQPHTGVGLYWRLEKKLRQWESASSSVVGATGAFYAVRKHLIPRLPPGTILDDLYIPLYVARSGMRVLFDHRARAWDKVYGSRLEFQRKIRTLVGNYQLLRIAPWVLTSSNPLRFEFVGHKLMRLVAPFALGAFLFSSIFMPTLPGRIALGSQILFYSAAGLSVTRLKLGLITRMADAAHAFVLLNLAALVAFLIFVTGRKVEWGRSKAAEPSRDRTSDRFYRPGPGIIEGSATR